MVGPSTRDLTQLVLLATVYFFAAKAGLSLASVHPSATAVWPASGIALAAVLLLGYRAWPGIFAGAFFVNLLVNVSQGTSTSWGAVGVASGIAAGNTLEAVSGAFLVNRFAGGRGVFEGVQSVFRFAVLAGMLSTTVSATIGVTSLCLGAGASWTTFGAVWWTWWLGDAVGDLVVAPLLVVWSARPRPHWHVGRAAESLLLLLSAILVGQFVFGEWYPAEAGSYPLAYLATPLLIWAAFRFGQHGATATVAVVSAIALWGTLHGSGPFTRTDPNESLLLLQCFLGTFSVTAIALAAVVLERARVQEASAHLASIVESSDDGIIGLRMDGVVATWNAGAERLLGYSGAEVIGRPASILVRAGRADEYERILKRVQQGEKVATLETECARKGGDLYDVSMTISPIKDRRNRTTGLSTIVRDITERKRAEAAVRLAHEELERKVEERTAALREANEELKKEVLERRHAEESLRRSEARLAEAQHIARIGSWELDVVANQVTWSDELYRIYSLSPAEFEATYEGFLERVHPEDRERVDRAVRRASSTAEPFGFDHRILLAGGGVRTVHAEGKVATDPACRVVKMMGTCQDITEHERMENALRESERRYRCVADSANEGIVSADSSGRIIAWNKAAETMFGYGEDEVKGRPLQMLMPERYRDAHRAGLERLQSTGQARLIGKSVELSGLKKDGHEFPVELSLASWQTEEGSFFTGIIRDITERKIADERVRRLNSELEERVNERTAELRRSNEELQQFAYVASHDLQEPLRMVSSYARLLARRYQGRLDGDADEFITYVVDGATRMNHLINDLLAYSRVDTQAGSFVPTDCTRALCRAMDNLQVAIRECGAIVTHGSLPTMMADGIQLVQLFQNLIANSIKFRRPQLRPEVRVDAEPKDGEWIFSVRDNGIGIDPEHAERIFVIFQRLHLRGEYPGTGIGLAICKKIVERHGGRIHVVSRPGEGSVFYFTLPAERCVEPDPGRGGEPVGASAGSPD